MHVSHLSNLGDSNASSDFVKREDILICQHWANARMIDQACSGGPVVSVVVRYQG